MPACRQLTLCALMLTLCGWGPQAQAQSSYTLSTLKSSNSLAASPLRLDSQNNALGTAYYYSRIGFPIYATGATVPLFGGLAMIYSPGLTVWPASTTASVTPRRLSGDDATALSVSADGRWIHAISTLYAVNGTTAQRQTPQRFDVVAGQSVSMVYGSSGARSLNNAGTLSSTVRINGVDTATAERAVVWEGPNLIGRFLPQDGFRSSFAMSVADNGSVAGGVADVATGLVHAAVWGPSGTRVVDQQPGRGSVARQVNAAGQVLMCVADAVVSSDTVEGITYMSTRYSRLRPVVFSAGVEQEILPSTPGQGVTAWAMNADGVVVGRTGDYAGVSYANETPRVCINTANSTSTGSSRAFIWANGVTSDLTTWVAAKGVKLPTGAVLTDAYDINDQGSILAVMRASNGALSQVRLIAKP